MISVYRPKETDWKTYSKRLPEWRDRYFEILTEHLADELRDSAKSPTDRFWDTLRRHKKSASEVERALGDHCRSEMFMNLLGMLGLGMIEESDLGDFSDELRIRLLSVHRSL